MYKNPELSTMAKILARELKEQGLEMKHTKALELVAKMHGARNLHVHQAAAVEAAPVTADYLQKGMLQDWEKLGGFPPERLTERQHREFEYSLAKHGSQLFIDVCLPHSDSAEIDGTDQLSLVVEVHKGRPSVMLTNERYGDQLLRVTGTAGGLYLEPESSTAYICTGVPSDESLLQIQEEARGPNGTYSVMNNAFVSNSNAKFGR